MTSPRLHDRQGTKAVAADLSIATDYLTRALQAQADGDDDDARALFTLAYDFLSDATHEMACRVYGGTEFATKWAQEAEEKFEAALSAACPRS